MYWILLLISGLGECFWATMIKLSHGFHYPLYSFWTIVGYIGSFVLLVLATKELPISIAYPVWTGIGAVGSVLAGVFLFHESLPPLAYFFVGLLICSIIGLQITAGH